MTQQEEPASAQPHPTDQLGAPPPVGYAPRLIKPKLSQIVGLHQAVEALYRELMIPPLRFAARIAQGDVHLSAALARHPPMVMRVNRRLRCVGNVRSYFCARAVLADDAGIDCIEVIDWDEKCIKEGCIAELLYSPVLARAHFSEIPILANVARRARAAGLWSSPQPSLENYLARLYGVDPRRLTQRNSPSDSATPSDDLSVEPHASAHETFDECAAAEPEAPLAAVTMEPMRSL